MPESPDRKGESGPKVEFPVPPPGTIVEAAFEKDPLPEGQVPALSNLGHAKSEKATLRGTAQVIEVTGKIDRHLNLSQGK
jgi:hypothetical protein